ncbi:hypothetical protein E2C01_075116 [Portunus trituberculatus]|uniref:Uncharacterized protein n=1 Tax=Portunus trituberculatus TaxID=210409 RepID=A0A5B7IF02_PORTR|nr:hypothetical protein [Portunus trituberculatus]
MLRYRAVCEVGVCVWRVTWAGEDHQDHRQHTIVPRRAASTPRQHLIKGRLEGTFVSTRSAPLKTSEVLVQAAVY